MKFLIDAQLPPGLARWLEEHGHEAVHVREVGMSKAEDTEIWKRAMEEDWVVVTKDEDFAERVAHSRISPRIVWLRVGNTTNAALREWLTPRLDNVLLHLHRGDSIVEVR